ncbi:MAG TPA: alanine racemase [bacterium]|nr:alanine racemase [bacterium]
MNPRTDVIAEVDLRALRHNIIVIQDYIHPAGIIGVVKANAYGHGCIPVAKVLVEEGVDLLAVVAVEEAIQLRGAGVQMPVLLMGKVWDHHLPQVFEYNLQPIVASAEDYERFATFARRERKQMQVHLKIDTGMGRMGVLYDEYSEVFRKITQDSSLQLVGIMSHFASAENPNGLAPVQAERFRRIYDEISNELQDDKPVFHLANSAAMLYMDGQLYDRVRLGLSLYGLTPAELRPAPVRLQPVMSLKSFITYVKVFPTDFPIGYGSTYTTRKDSTIAICSGGYEDGIPRRYGNTGEVLIHGKRFPVVGNVSMDTFMVDVGQEPVDIGDEVVIFGRQGDEFISIWEMANKLQVIPYEVICGISQRVTREYVVI